MKNNNFEGLKRVIILTNTNSIKGRSIFRSIKHTNIEIEKVIAIDTDFLYYIKLFKFVSKRVGFFQAIIFSFLKIFGDFIHELFFCNLKSLNYLTSKYKVPIVYIKGRRNWQKLASNLIDNCDSKIIIIGQIGILGHDFDLNRNDRLILNSHPGKLPEFRGLDSFKWAILKNDWENLACSIHVVREKIDAGEIIKINNYNWRKLNWFFIDRQLLIISGNDLVKFLLNLNSKDPVKQILMNSKKQINQFNLHHKMNILTEFKCLGLYLFKKYLERKQ